MHRILISISTSKYFDLQSEMADFLGIVSSSKKAIASRCKLNGWGVEFDSYDGEYNIDVV